jgi:hypothetical protein
VILAGVEAVAAVEPWMQSVGKCHTCRRREHSTHTDWASKTRHWHLPTYRTTRTHNPDNSNLKATTKFNTKQKEFIISLLHSRLWKWNCNVVALYYITKINSTTALVEGINYIQLKINLINLEYNSVTMDSCNRQKLLHNVEVINDE